ncbi:MAG: sialate O-acetylesterase [Allosphingosinicella sp.]|uniref:sialate O-acetylesterase n=1 Tax=Allosphingosinicella sp. TaxID=2823234 RepID=UPI003938C56A
MALLMPADELAAVPTLHPLFSDHAVLQRGRPIAVWGSADPGERLTVSLSGAVREVRADQAGRWRAELPAMPGGGPLRLTVAGRDGRGAQAADILIGDVWLCSGQSNMEWPVRGALNADAELASASDEGMRILTVPQRTSLAPEEAFGEAVAWQTVSPETVRDFSAACYFMARDLRRREQVPVGVIDASWGGTQIRSWMSEAAVRATDAGDMAELLDLYRRDADTANRRFGGMWADWWRGRTGDAEGSEPWHASDRLSWRPVPAIRPWEQWGDPAFAEFNGFVWARKRVVLTAEQAAGAAMLSLGVIDDLDQSWVNGVPVGNSFGWSLDRDYRVPAGVLRAGVNEILVNIGDSWGLGGFQGPAERLRLTLADGSVVPLGDGWEYAVVDPAVGNPPRAPWDTHAGVSPIYNGMIAPLGRFGLSGVAWYQGESDVGVTGYAGRLAAMMAGWRAQFGQRDLPFLVVGLAGFGAPARGPGPSGWAELREQQRRASGADRHAILVPAVDLGHRRDIHPPDKQEVGRRLALAASGQAGPEIAAARRSGGEIILSFRGVAGGLRSWSGQPLGFELCGETQDSCRFVAAATVAGSEVRLQGDGRSATRVRYAWADFPLINLYDEDDLTPAPFELRLD